jgi:hypothetical protein
MNGGKVAQEMRRLKPGVPKMLFSGSWGIPEEEMNAFQEYCAKPVGLPAFSAQVCEMVSHAQQA